MAARTFGFQTLAGTNSAQPLIRTTVTTTKAPSPGNLTNIVVGSSANFQAGDTVLLSAGTARAERANVFKVVDSTNIQFQSTTGSNLANTHNATDFIALSIPCQCIYVQSKPGNAADLWLGNSILLKTDGTAAIADLLATGAGVQPIDWSSTRNCGWDALMSDEIWIAGTANDSYLPSLFLV